MQETQHEMNECLYPNEDSPGSRVTSLIGIAVSFCYNCTTKEVSKTRTSKQTLAYSSKSEPIRKVWFEARFNTRGSIKTWGVDKCEFSNLISRITEEIRALQAQIQYSQRTQAASQVTHICMQSLLHHHMDDLKWTTVRYSYQRIKETRIDRVDSSHACKPRGYANLGIMEGLKALQFTSPPHGGLKCPRDSP